MRRTRRFTLACASALFPLCVQAVEAPFALIHAARFESVFPEQPGVRQVMLETFELQRTPVTNADYAQFVAQHPQWRRGQVPAVFADASYLSLWSSELGPGESIARQPVVQVSWFAATAYCESIGARLPTWHEWEWAAAADEKQEDARNDPEWRQRMLNWYSQTGNQLHDVGAQRPDVRGIHDLHGLVWEWVEDQASLMVSADNREQGDPDVMKFCGTGALTMEQKEHYAVLMRIAMLSSMEPRYTTANTGFRCARTLVRETER